MNLKFWTWRKRKTPIPDIGKLDVHEAREVAAEDLSICDPAKGENRWLRLVAQLITVRPEFDWFEGLPWPRAECVKMLWDGTMPDEALAQIAERFNAPFSVLSCFDVCTVDDLKYAFAQKCGVEK